MNTPFLLSLLLCGLEVNCGLNADCIVDFIVDTNEDTITETKNKESNVLHHYIWDI